MSISTRRLVGRELRDGGNRPVGKITAVYQYPVELNAPWGAAAVTLGLIRKSTHLVDLEDADLDGHAVRVPYASDTIKAAPNHPPLIGDTLADHHAVDVRAYYLDGRQPGQMA